MKIIVLAVGKRHDTALEAAITDYATRLQKYCRFEWQLVPAAGATMPAATKRTLESKRLTTYLRPGDAVIVLDERGRQLATPEIANFLADARQHVPPRIVLVIGGAHGVSEEFRASASYVWALSKLVFPHQLVRLIVAEQLYRAFTIVAGEPYHHE